MKTRLTTVVRVFLRSHVRVPVFVMQGGSCSKGDIYEVVLEIDKSVSEPLQIFDTSGEVSVSRRPFMFLSVFVLPKLYDMPMALLADPLYACFFFKHRLIMKAFLKTTLVCRRNKGREALYLLLQCFQVTVDVV